MASTTASSAMAPQSSTAKTRVPGGSGSGTSGALSSTVPTASVPGTKGKGGLRWYLPATTNCVAKETPAAATLIRTPPGRSGGGGISFTSSWSNSRQLSQTNAFISVGPDIGITHQLAPARILRGDETREMLRRIRYRHRAERGHARLRLGLTQRPGHRLLQGPGDVGRAARRRPDAVPG